MAESAELAESAESGEGLEFGRPIDTTGYQVVPAGYDRYNRSYHILLLGPMIHFTRLIIGTTCKVCRPYFIKGSLGPTTVPLGPTHIRAYGRLSGRAYQYQYLPHTVYLVQVRSNYYCTRSRSHGFALPGTIPVGVRRPRPYKYRYSYCILGTWYCILVGPSYRTCWYWNQYILCWSYRYSTSPVQKCS